MFISLWFLSVLSGVCVCVCACVCVCLCVRVHMLSAAQLVWLFAILGICSPPGSSVHGISQARILEWVAITLSGDLPDPGIKPMSLASPALAGRFFTTEPPGKSCVKWSFINISKRHLGTWYSTSAAAAAAKSLQSCPTLCNPIDSSPPGSPIARILQASTLEWVAITFSPAWKWKVEVKSLSPVWLSDPMDCSPTGSSIHGIFQARVLEWGAIAFSG